MHAWDEVRIDSCPAVEGLTLHDGWTKPKYIGWTPVSEILCLITVRDD